MKDFLVLMAGVLIGSLLFALILGDSAPSTVSLKSETGVVMKGVVNQMHELVP